MNLSILSVLLLVGIPLAWSTPLTVSVGVPFDKASHACMTHAETKWLEYLRLAFAPVGGQPDTHYLGLAQRYYLFYQFCARAASTFEELQWMHKKMRLSECALKYGSDSEPECIQHHE